MTLTPPPSLERIFEELRSRIYDLEVRQSPPAPPAVAAGSTSVGLVFAKQMAGTENADEAPVQEQIYDSPWGGLFDPRVDDPQAQLSGWLVLDFDTSAPSYFNGWNYGHSNGLGDNALEWGYIEQYNNCHVGATFRESENTMLFASYTPVLRYNGLIYAGSNCREYGADADSPDGSDCITWHEHEIQGFLDSAHREDTCGIYLSVSASVGSGSGIRDPADCGAQVWVRPRLNQVDPGGVSSLVPMYVGEYSGGHDLEVWNNGDLRFLVATCGPIVWDRDDATAKRLFVDSGVLQVEAA